MAFPTTPILDDFSGTLVAWTTPAMGAPNAFSIITGAIQGGAFPGISYNTKLAQDVEWYLDVPTTTLAGNSIYLQFRADSQSSTWNGYECKITCSSGVWQFHKVVAGVASNIGSALSQIVSNGDSIGVNPVGSNLQAYYKAAAGSFAALGSPIVDSTYLQPGYVGVGAEDATVRLDNAGGGPIFIPGLTTYPPFPNPRLRRP